MSTNVDDFTRRTHMSIEELKTAAFKTNQQINKETIIAVTLVVRPSFNAIAYKILPSGFALMASQPPALCCAHHESINLRKHRANRSDVYYHILSRITDNDFLVASGCWRLLSIHFHFDCFIPFLKKEDRAWMKNWWVYSLVVFESP